MKGAGNNPLDIEGAGGREKEKRETSVSLKNYDIWTGNNSHDGLIHSAVYNVSLCAAFPPVCCAGRSLG